MTIKTILLAQPRGFCAGVVRAYDIVDMAVDAASEPVYVLKEIVHNRHVVEELRQKGARFVQDLDEVPEGSLAVFSAHGVSPAVRDQAAGRGLRMIDATCPLVTKVHLQARKYAGDGYTILLVGHRDHDEVIGTSGEAPEQTIVVESRDEVMALDLADDAPILAVTQTTLSVDDTADIIAAIRERFPQAAVRNDICFATTNRQAAVKAITSRADVVIVVGAANSSNSVRLMEVAQAEGTPAYRIDSVADMQDSWLEGATTVGVTSGASTPEHLVWQVVERLKTFGPGEIEEIRIADETVTFQLPSELIRLREAAGIR